MAIDLSDHPDSGASDNHRIPGEVYGRISKGLKPLMPVFDRLFTSLVSGLEDRGLLDDTLVIVMGEFGRTPQIGTKGSQDGRNPGLKRLSENSMHLFEFDQSVFHPCKISPPMEDAARIKKHGRQISWI